MATLDDNTAQTTIAYDGAGRAYQTTDALGNVVLNTFDEAGNVVMSNRSEVCTITTPTVANEVFSVLQFFDSLNRLIVRAEQGADGSLAPTLPTPSGAASSGPIYLLADTNTLARTSVFGFDSRGNQVVAIDPSGDATLSFFDGAGRQLQTQQILQVATSLGNNTIITGLKYQQVTVSLLSTTRTLDANGRLAVLTDARGNSTFFGYDSLDRMLTMTFADGSTRDFSYDFSGDVTGYIDENGSTFANSFDPLGRKYAVVITPYNSVGTTGQAFQYDGLSRMTQAQDSIGSDTVQSVLVYDSLSRLLEDSQSYTVSGFTRNMTNTDFTSYPVSGFELPNNRQFINYYDLLYRRNKLVDNTIGPTTIAQWQFFGPGRVAEVLLGNGLYCTWMNNTRTHSAVQMLVPTPVANPSWGTSSSDRLGYDGAGQPITKRFLAGGLSGSSYANTTAVVGVTTAYDLSGNKFYERHLHAPDRSHLYVPYDSNPEGGYDSLNRLLQYQRGVLSSTGGYQGKGGGSVSSPTGLPGANINKTYTLDQVGNWQQTTFTPQTTATLNTEKRAHNNVNEILLRNNLTTPSFTPLTYDGVPGASNGNLANDGTLSYTWDALNRLLQVDDAAGTTTYAECVYDAFNRRIQKTVSNGGVTSDIPNGTTDFLYDGWRCVEERDDGTDTPTMQYTWGIYLDECLQVLNIAGINNFAANSVLYPLQDLLYRTVGLTDSSGVVREAYDTDAYGNTLIFRASGSPPAMLTFADSDRQVNYPTCPFIFTGQRYDAESRIYYYKMRYYGPVLGRFLSRDPLALETSDPSLFGYVFGRATVWLDPAGLQVVTHRHHWFRAMRDPDTQAFRGQAPVDRICPPNRGLRVDINKFTTPYPGDVHLSTIHGQWRYNASYERLLSIFSTGYQLPSNCCLFLLGMWVLMHIYDRRARPQLNAFTLEHYTTHVNTMADYEALMVLACSEVRQSDVAAVLQGVPIPEGLRALVRPPVEAGAPPTPVPFVPPPIRAPQPARAPASSAAPRSTPRPAPSGPSIFDLFRLNPAFGFPILPIIPIDLDYLFPMPGRPPIG